MPNCSNSYWLRVFRWLLAAAGAMSVMSAVVNIIAAVQLFEPSDEAALGISRREVIWWYMPVLVGGLVMLYYSFRPLRRK